MESLRVDDSHPRMSFIICDECGHHPRLIVKRLSCRANANSGRLLQVRRTMTRKIYPSFYELFRNMDTKFLTLDVRGFCGDVANSGPAETSSVALMAVVLQQRSMGLVFGLE